MTSEQSIQVGVFDGCSWIRCEGKGSFVNSPMVKTFGDERVNQGEKVLVVDLEACSGMDSTFMGTMAGLASRMMGQNEGVLQVVGASEKSIRSLEDLGLDNLIEINPKEGVWVGQEGEIRGKLSSPNKPTAMDMLQRKQHVLESHVKLSELSEKNAQIFADVVDSMTEEVKRQQEKSGEKRS